MNNKHCKQNKIKKKRIKPVVDARGKRRKQRRSREHKRTHGKPPKTSFELWFSVPESLPLPPFFLSHSSSPHPKFTLQIKPLMR
jgi:hypothetical protein